MHEKYDIVFEIVESDYIEKFEYVVNFISKVEKCNCKIAIDNFGTSTGGPGKIYSLQSL